MAIQYLIMDIDGTLTDGKIYIGPEGECMKAFSVKDGYSINYILKKNGITPVVITARNSDIVRHRCEELGIDAVYQGRPDKLAAAEEAVGKDGLGVCACFGDDILDMKCMLPIQAAGGIAGCPADAVQEVRAIADYVCVNRAGDGALREFSEWLTGRHSNSSQLKERINDALKYLSGLRVTEDDIGCHEVDRGFYYTVQSYDTKPETACGLESHREYVDIQIMVSGIEAMDLADVGRLQVRDEYDPERDIMFWKIPDRMTRMVLNAGSYIILYPEHAHRGAVLTGKSTHVLKIVGKVKIWY